jgi:hypothetical protein
MDKSKNSVMTISASMEEAKTLLQRRFLLIQTNYSNNYLDTIDNTVNSFATVQGVLMHRFGITQNEAYFILKNSYVNSYSGQQVYRPDYPNYKVLNINDKWVLNTYRPPKIKPDPSISPKPFVDHLNLAIRDSEAVEFLLDFIAYRYQNPLVDDRTGKPAHALYIFSKAQGQGKSLFADTLTMIFGDTAVKTTTTADSLLKQNGYQYWERTWLLADEVKIGDGTRLYDNLKARISKTSDFVDPKGKASIEAKLPAQLIMTSNHEPTFIEADDRRFCIIEWDTGLRDEAKENYFNEYIEWLNKEGHSAIAGLLQTRDLSGYKPNSPPPKTDAKLTAILKSESTDVDRVLEHLAIFRDQIAFKATAFDDLRIPNKVKEQVLGHAGLSRKRPYLDGNKIGIWIRDGYSVKAGNIVNATTGELIKTLHSDIDSIPNF